MITVFGGTGFIGSHLVRRARGLGLECRAPARDELPADVDLGAVIYAIGLTADFRTRPFETVDAHVSHLGSVLRACRFDSLLYLSSTRLYRRADEPATEDAVLRLDPQNPSDLYDLSKAMGESLALTTAPSSRVARLSNVYGFDAQSPTFLSEVVRSAVRDRRVVMQTSPESAKDYIDIDSAADTLLAIAQRGRQRVYNVASGHNVTNARIAAELQRLTDCEVSWTSNAPTVTFPTISVDRTQRELGASARSLIESLPALVRTQEARP